MADQDEHEPETIAEEHVLMKYNTASGIVNDVLKAVIGLCVEGATIQNICREGDRLLAEKTAEKFKKDKEMKKGVAFPTCVSVNNCICHFSPLMADPPVLLKDGDLVKLDMGAHLDGFAAVVAHTLVVGASKENKVTGRKADVVLAAHYAAEAALRLVKPGNENFTVTDTITKVADQFKCKPVEGMLSHQLIQHIIDGEKAIIQNPSDMQRKEHDKCEFEAHEVYAVDVIVSTGEGKGKEMETRTTVYKKRDTMYQLKMKTSRQFISEVEKRSQTYPFSIRSFSDEKKAKMGVIECAKHELVEPFNVLFEKPDELVAQFKYTLLLMPSSVKRITTGNFDPNMFESEYKIEDEEIKALLAKSVAKSAAKRKKKQAQKAMQKNVAEVAAAAAAATPAGDATASASNDAA